MTRSWRGIAIAAVVIGLLFLCACSSQNQNSGNASQSSSAGNTSQSSSASGRTEESASASAGEQAMQSQAVEKETECNWTMEVSDTVTAKVQGYDFTCTLAIMAIKLSGQDELGTYRGTVTLKYQYDMKQGNIAGNAAGEGQEIDAIIEVVPYDKEKYDDSAGKAGLSELVEYDAMALGNFILTGGGTASESAGGASWGTSDSRTIPVPFRMAVDGGQLTIELTTVAPGVKFGGMITGTPI